MAFITTSTHTQFENGFYYISYRKLRETRHLRLPSVLSINAEKKGHYFKENKKLTSYNVIQQISSK